MQVVAEVDARELAVGVQFVAERAVIVWKGEDGSIRATRNRCAHQGGRFTPMPGCQVRCPHHGWVLDLDSMCYSNPTNGQKQPELKIETRGHRLVFLEPAASTPWGEPGLRSDLKQGELTVRFYAHAAAELTLGSKTLFTDPWLVGPAFLRGWWLQEAPPDDALERLANADSIFISHNHSDHLNPPTLRMLRELRPDAHFLIPPFESCAQQLESLGFSNVEVVPFDSWLAFGDARIMVLRDGTTREDSGLLVEYAGRRILNTVDCSDLNGGQFPNGVDVLLMSFAGGASGYPACWTDMYSDEEIALRVRADRSRIRSRIVETVKATDARIFVPFAGYFTEAHPSDADVKARNVKNSPEAVIASVEQATRARGWRPLAGAMLDLSSSEVQGGTEAPAPPAYNFDEYLREFEAAMDFEPLQTTEGLLDYFRWTGFRGDLVLHIIETDEGFERTIRDVAIDLSGPRVIGEETLSGRRYLRMRVRADVFRHVLMRGLPWEELTIGFCARFLRSPDVYNMDFWAHVQDKLPAMPPWAERI